MLLGTRLLSASRALSLFVVLLVGLGTRAVSAPVKSGEQVLRGIRVESAPALDGVLGDDVWKNAPPTRNFKQKEPTEGEDASETTSVQVVYTAKSLFLGITCLDSAPDKVVASELRRDGDLQKDDSIWILIDSNHDHRNALLFATNAQGTQYDALITDEGKDVNINWDGVWDVIANRNENGWTAEIEIPFKTLRLKETTGRTGLEFRRIIRRKNEFDFWNTWDRNFQFEQVSLAGHLIGLKDIELGTHWRLKPYGLGGVGRKGAGGWGNRSEIGVDDFKWRLTPTLTSDLTYNTDFAEVQVDSQQSNLANPRNALFFPEKREFFLEGAGFFDFTAQLDENQRNTFLGFFSRRIGLSADGQMIPVRGGGKLTGKVGALSIGALNMQTEDQGPIAGNNFGVMRARYDLFSRSRVGAIVTNRSGDGSFNRTAGVDTRLVFWNNFVFEGFLMQSATPGVNSDQNAYYAQAYWRTDLWKIGAGHLTLEPNFNPELGFADRLNTRKSIVDLAFKPRPKISWLRQIEIRPFFEYWADQHNVVEQKIFHYNIELLFQNGARFRYAPHPRFERLVRPLRIAPSVVVPRGDYSSTSHVFEYFVDPSRALAGSFKLAFYTNYFGGQRTNYSFNPQWKPTPSLILDLNYDLNRMEFGGKRFLSQVANFGINYSLSTRLLTSTVFQYNNITAQVKAVNFRLRYIYRPGDDIYVVYKYIHNTLNPELSDKAILLKFTRSFEF